MKKYCLSGKYISAIWNDSGDFRKNQTAGGLIDMREYHYYQ